MMAFERRPQFVLIVRQECASAGWPPPQRVWLQEFSCVSFLYWISFSSSPVLAFSSSFAPRRRRVPLLDFGQHGC